VTNLISIRNLHYRPESFPPEAPDILKGINMDIDKGAFIAIIGRNGSGKTTLIKHINGLLTPSMGKIHVGGLDTSLTENHPELRKLVGMVFQNPADQIVASTVEEDVAFGLENLNLPAEEIHKRVRKQLENADLLEESQRPPHLLSGGQIQRLALAGVLARHPDVILFDEPTSMLDPLTRKSFLERITRLHSHGMTIIYITQHMEEAYLAEKVVVINEGQIITSGKPEEIFKKSAMLYEIGLDIPEAAKFAEIFRGLGWSIPEDIFTPDDLLDALPEYQSRNVSKISPSPQKSPDSTIISVEDVHYTYLAGSPLSKNALTGASLEVKKAVIQGLVGTNGSGKSTLLQHLNGILRPNKGKVRVEDLSVENPETPLIEVVKKVGLVFQNPETQFFEVFVGDEIAFGPKQFHMNNIRERVRDAMALVGLDFETFKDRRLETLSGGEKRKVALASTLILDQNILLFDEPTAGMDPQSRDELLSLFAHLQEQGKTILIASHRLDEIAQISSYISVMKSGKVLKTSATRELLFENKVIETSGLIPPLIVRILEKLQENGWPIERCNCLDFQSFKSFLEELGS
jgi:energy-coupling factor transport system ATP-binding protein